MAYLDDFVKANIAYDSARYTFNRVAEEVFAKDEDFNDIED